MNLQPLIPLIRRALIPDQSERDRLLRRLAGALPETADQPLAGPAVSAPPVLTRQPVVNMPEPPPPNSNWVVRRSLDPPQPILADTPPPALPTPTMSELGAPPILIRRNNKNRPLEALGGQDSLERDQALLDAQSAYKAPRSTKDLLIRLGLGFVGGGIPGAVRQGLGYELNQDVRNQDAVGSDMAQTQERLQRGLLQRNQVNDLLNDQSTREYRNAQTADILTRATRPPKSDSKFIERPDGVYEVSATNPDGRKIGNIPPEARSKNANPTRYFERPDGVYGINDEHPEGFKVSGVPGTPEKPDDSGFTNELIQRNIQEAASERDRIWDSLKTIPSTVETVKTDPYTLEQTKVQEPNPVYTDLIRRGRELDDHIRTYRGQLKAPKATRGATKYTEADVRARAAAMGKNADAAVAKARAAGLLR